MIEFGDEKPVFTRFCYTCPGLVQEHIRRKLEPTEAFLR